MADRVIHINDAKVRKMEKYSSDSNCLYFLVNAYEKKHYYVPVYVKLARSPFRHYLFRSRFLSGSAPPANMKQAAEDYFFSPTISRPLFATLGLSDTDRQIIEEMPGVTAVETEQIADINAKIIVL